MRNFADSNSKPRTDVEENLKSFVVSFAKKAKKKLLEPPRRGAALKESHKTMDYLLIAVNNAAA